MRRLLLPVVLLAVAVTATVLAGRANDTASGLDAADGDSKAALGTPLLSVRRAPEWLREPATDQQLQSNGAAALGVVGDRGTACLSLHRDGEPIAEIESATALVPGELQRLLVIATLDTLARGGFTTEVVRGTDSVVADGVLDGDLWFIGAGDPTLSTDGFVSRFGDDRAATSLDDLATQVVEALQGEGITTIAGSVIGFDSKYGGSPQQYPNAEWSTADIASNTVGLVGGLLVDNGFASFPTEFDPLANVRAGDATTHAAQKLTDLLVAAGITVQGAPATGAAPDPGARTTLGTINSLPLRTIAARAAVDGTTAEMLLREIAIRSGAPVALNPALNVRAQILDEGYIAEDDLGNVVVQDGSGLSLNSTVTCGVLTNALDEGEGSFLVDALPDGAASAAAECLPTELEELTLHASARPEVTAVAGRAVATNGDVLTFTAIANWLPDPESGLLTERGVCDDLVPAVLAVLAGHPDGPSLDELEPLSPGHRVLNGSAMTYRLPMFPLEQTVLPTALVPLHVFEPRYRELARFVTAQDEPEFGVTMIERGREVGGGDLRAAVGVVGRIVEFEEFPDGRWAIIATGTRRIRIDQWLDDDPYPAAMVADWPDADVVPSSGEPFSGAAADAARMELQSLVDRLAGAARRLDPDRAIPSLHLPDDPAQAIWQACVLGQLGPLDAMTILEAPGVRDRAPVALAALGERVEMVEALADEAG